MSPDVKAWQQSVRNGADRLVDIIASNGPRLPIGQLERAKEHIREALCAVGVERRK